MTEQRAMRGFIANLDSIPPLVVLFQFNPESIQDNKSVNYADRSGDLCGNGPGKVYTGGGHRTISFDLKLHGLEQGTDSLNPTGFDNGIAPVLATLRSFLYPVSDAWASVHALIGMGGKRLQAPPTCLFGFGPRLLECIVTDLSITESQFNRHLTPVRAEVKVTLTVTEDLECLTYLADTQHRNVLAALNAVNTAIVQLS